MKRIGIIGAMEEEVASFKEKMEIQEVRTIAGMEFCRGICENQPVIIVRSGIGKVNASVCTQILCDVLQAEVIINTGVAGSLKNAINIGDIVLSVDALQHDMDATGFGYEPGVIPRMETSVFKADDALVDLAERVCREVNPDIQVFRGRVVSGDLFRDGVDYPPETGAYLDLLARLHRDLAARADRVTELVCGLPVHWKGGEV